jgi:hypothetical protein
MKGNHDAVSGIWDHIDVGDEYPADGMPAWLSTVDGVLIADVEPYGGEFERWHAL